MVTDTELHTADVMLPISSDPIARGGIVVRGGRIVEVGVGDELILRFPDVNVMRWAGVLMPGLVNAHAHLQFTSFAPVGASPFEDYTAWSIRFVDEYDARVETEDWVASAHAGAQTMLANGITCIADIVTDFAARDVLFELDVPGVVYLELIGVDEPQWIAGLGEQLRHAVESAPTSDVTTVGISPHAPYSVDAPVLTLMADLAHELGVRLHIHVAESDGEDEFYRTGSGALADRVRVVATRRVGVLETGGVGLGAAEFVRSLGVLGPTCHVAHGVYLGRDGRAVMAEEGTLVALCPRSNATVGVDPPPVADFLREHVPFAVGTDSLGSTPSLDLLADVATLRDLARADGYGSDDLDRRLLEAATMCGARALGLDHALGSLEPGNRADFAVFDLPGDPVTVADAERRMVTTGASHCVATYLAGELRAGTMPT